MVIRTDSNSMKPIRTEKKQEVVYDSWTGIPHPLQDQETDHFITSQGSVESQTIGRQIALQCGCLKPAGGFCSECGALVCIDCFGHCNNCSRPLGGCHSILVNNPDGTRIRLCQACHDSSKRREARQRIWRTLLSPFVKFEEDSNAK